MEQATGSPLRLISRAERAKDESGFFSSESVLDVLKLILAGSPLPEVLAIIAQLVESQGEGTFCTIWLPDGDERRIHCAAAPSLPGFSAQVGPTLVSPKGASCGTAVYRREPVYVTDILSDSLWDDYRDAISPFGIRAVWSRPLFSGDGKVLGTFAILYREVRSPSAADLQLIENAGHIAGIAIERDLNEQKLRHERDRLRLLLKITKSMTSKLDLGHLVATLSPNLLSVTRSDFCALLLPHVDRIQLRATVLYNPESRGAIPDGTIVPVKGARGAKGYASAK